MTLKNSPELPYCLDSQEPTVNTTNEKTIIIGQEKFRKPEIKILSAFRKKIRSHTKFRKKKTSQKQHLRLEYNTAIIAQF